MLSDYNLIREACSSYTEYCAGKLRRQKSVASAILINVQTNSFRTQDEQYFNHTIVTLPIPTNDSSILIKHACDGLDRIFKNGLKYKRISVSLIGLFPNNNVQGNLFEQPNPKKPMLQKVIDKLNFKYEENTIRIASCGFNRKHWESKAEIRSPRYSTRLLEILTLGEDALLKKVK
ncbi:MAG: DUF4113 domain-containing protein [Saprospirales bacterium]|nr:DUF4113 domain-containing protein [Saprospirales bacterium]